MKAFFVRHKKQLLLFGPVVILIGLLVGLQILYDRTSPAYSLRLKAIQRDLIPSELLSYGHFGFRTILADLYWLRAIQDFVSWNGKELFFLDYFKNISTLDPKFEHPYLFAIWTIPINKDDVARLDMVANVAEKGIQQIPSSWQIPYHLGTQYYLFTKSYEKAKEYLRIAAERPNAPLGVYLNYSSFVINEVKGHKASMDLVKVIYDNTTDETLKKVIALGMQTEIVQTMIERGIVAYKTSTGKYPTSLDDLTKNLFVSLPETFLERFTVTINNKNGSFKIEEKQ